MRILDSWLRSFADPAVSTADLAHLLTMSGLEVESVQPVAGEFSGVVVGEVIHTEKHADADKLTVCKVDVGGEILQIVCGAPNVRRGLKAPLARIGARLPGGMDLKQAKMRGVESFGMLCSARELGLSQDHAGLLELDAGATIGEDVRSALALDDLVLTLKLTPNRADCLSVLGVAREVSALAGVALARPVFPAVPASSDARLAVRVTAPDLCGRFSGRVVCNVNARAATPGWMKQRLERSGQRPISALVDISNYVMLELGRPTHIFDLDKVTGGLEIRWARPGEWLGLLNGQTVELGADVGVVADDSGVEALAGIMGGAATAVSDDTRNIFIEAAFWWPEAIAGRSRRFNFSTEAAHRFERGVDFASTTQHIEHVTRLVLEICGGAAGPTDDTIVRLPAREPVRMRVARAQKLIGVRIPADEMADIFKRLGFEFTRADDALVVTPPSFRFDLQIEEDLVEEIARVHGFDRIPAEPPRAAARIHVPSEASRSLHEVRERLAAADYVEVINFSFVEPQWEADLAGEINPIRLLNPIASQLSVMRTTLAGGLVANLRHNLSRKLARIRVFEIGRVFSRDDEAHDGPLGVAGVRQPVRVAGAAYGPASEEQWGIGAREVDFFDVKSDLEALLAPRIARFGAAEHPALHPGRSARVTVDGATAGWLGELHPAWQRKYDLPRPAILFEIDAQVMSHLALPVPGLPSRFPPVVRDIAILVDAALPAQALLDAMEVQKPAIVSSLRVFDLYHGDKLPEGKKSLAFRVVMQDTERTLTDAEADAACDFLVALLGREFAATLRAEGSPK